MHKSGKFHAALLSATMFVGAVSPAAGILAAENGSWVKSGNLYWYKNADGTWPANTWAKINGKWYHFNDNGFMQSGWKKFDGNWYYLGDKNDGSMKTGWVNEGGKYYYLDSAGKMLTGWRTISGKSYYFWTDGSMAKNTTIDGYKVGADGAWIKEEVKPNTEQKPAVDTNSNLNATYVNIIKEAIQRFKADNPDSVYMNPNQIYELAIGVANEKLTIPEIKEFASHIVKQTGGGAVTGEAYPLTDEFYEYLAAAGYDFETNLNIIADILQYQLSGFIQDTGKPAEDIFSAAIYQLGLSQSMIQSLLNQLAQEGIISQEYAANFLATYFS